MREENLARHDLEFGLQLHPCLSPLQDSMKLFLIDVDGVLGSREQRVLLARLQERPHLSQLQRSETLAAEQIRIAEGFAGRVQFSTYHAEWVLNDASTIRSGLVRILEGLGRTVALLLHDRRCGRDGCGSGHLVFLTEATHHRIAPIRSILLELLDRRVVMGHVERSRCRLRRCQRFEIARARTLAYSQSIGCQIMRGAVGRFASTAPSSIFAASLASNHPSVTAVVTSSPSCSLLGSFIQSNPAGIRASHEVVGRCPLHL